MREKKYFARYRPARVETPNLVAAQVDSYSLLLQEGVKEAFKGPVRIEINERN